MATTTFDNLITFSRGSNATVTGPNGLIQWAPSNLLTNSQDFDAAAWVKTTVTVSANVANAPDSTATADRMTVSSTGAQAFLALNPGVTLGLPYTASIYVKRVNSDWFALSNQNFFAYFNLSGSGSIGTVGEGSASITAVGDGWFRITWSGSTSWSTAIRVRAVTADNNPAVVSGQEYLLWGAQLELGSTATTYNNTSVRNLLGFSEAFDNAAWGTPTGASIVTGAQANPVNGLFNAQKLMENTSTGLHFIAQAATTAAAPYTFSCYAKAAGRNFVFLYNPATNISLSVDLTTGATGQASGTVAPTSSSAVSVGNGWYRVSMTLTTTAASNNFRVYLGQSLTGTGSYTGDGNSGVYIYGAMLSNSASLDPYVPTPGAAPSSTAYYGPRFDYDPVTLLPRGLLIEEQRVNLLTYSDDFGNAVWAKVNITVTTNVATAPDGTSTADLVTYTGLGFGPRQSASTSPSAKTYSYYVKSSGGSRYFQILTDGSVQSFANFDIQTQTTGTVGTSVSSASVVSVGDGWYRLIMTATDASATSPYVGLVSGLTAGWSTGATTGAFFIWGAQLEAGAFATSYIPTIASTVTRSADVATITGSLFSQWYNQSAGAFVVEGDYAARINWRRFLTADDAAASGTNRIIINGDQDQQLLVTNGGVNQASLTAGTAPAANTVTEIASTYALDNFAAVRDGGTVVTDTSGTIPTVNRLNIGLHPNGSEYLNGHIRSIRYVPVRAADFQLQALTAPPELLSLNIYDRFNDLVLDRDGQTIEVR